MYVRHSRKERQHSIFLFIFPWMSLPRFLFSFVLQMLIINRTPNTLTNLTVELSTMGDLRLVERPQSHTIGPLDSRNIRANIKVSQAPAWTRLSVVCASLGYKLLNTCVPSAIRASPRRGPPGTSCSLLVDRSFLETKTDLQSSSCSLAVPLWSPCTRRAKRRLGIINHWRTIVRV